MYYVGLDLGQARDHSALAVVERVERQRAFQSSVFEGMVTRYVERMPLGMPYPAVVERVKDVMRQVQALDRAVLVVDATGVGAAVVDMLRNARLGCELTAVTITGGGRASGAGGRWQVPKQDLIGELQVLLEQGRLKIAVVKDTGRLVKELAAMKRAEGRSGRVRTREGPGEHDDLAIALALACWRGKGRRLAGEIGTQALPGIER